MRLDALLVRFCCSTNLSGETKFMDKKITGSGAKAYQRSDTEWRLKPYSDWHRTLDRRLLMADVDFIEWRYHHGELVPVGGHGSNTS